MILQTILIALAAIIIFSGIGTIIHLAFGGYKALEFRNKSDLRNLIDGVIGFFKLF